MGIMLGSGDQVNRTVEIPRGAYSLTGKTEKAELIFDRFDSDGCQEGKKQGTVTKRAGIKGASLRR